MLGILVHFHDSDRTMYTSPAISAEYGDVIYITLAWCGSPSSSQNRGKLANNLQYKFHSLSVVFCLKTNPLWFYKLFSLTV